MDEIKEKVFRYPQMVRNNEVLTCDYVKLAVDRFYYFMEREDIEFRQSKVDKVEKFMGMLKHFTGKHNNKPFTLEPWQYFIICNLFGFYYKGTNKRVTRNAYIEVARKCGKSALISAICLYCMIADGEANAEVGCIANARQQAKILFDASSNFIKPLDPKKKHFHILRDSITFPKTKSQLKVLSSDTTKLDGFNFSCFASDEMHENRDSKIW